MSLVRICDCCKKEFMVPTVDPRKDWYAIANWKDPRGENAKDMCLQCYDVFLKMIIPAEKVPPEETEK